MKQTELMIGDWVHIPMLDDATENYVCYSQVRQLYDCDLDCYAFKELKYEEVKPIPLTAEILERNGFIHCLTAPCGYYHAPVYEVFDILFHISKDTYEDTWHTEVFTDHNDNNFVLFNLCYVHELQNALRLCGLSDLADKLKMEE